MGCQSVVLTAWFSRKEGVCCQGMGAVEGPSFLFTPSLFGLHIQSQLHHLPTACDSAAQLHQCWNVLTVGIAVMGKCLADPAVRVAEARA